jgi:hypothetical protein
MSSSIEEKVVAMRLNNSDFEANAKKTLGTLGDLAKSLKLENAAKGLSAIASAAKNTNLDSVAAGVDGLAGKFSALSVIGVSALATITNKAVNAGISLVKSLTIDPIGAGFSDYTEKLTSVQTVMNATGKSEKEVGKYFSQLDTYADLTIYNLQDMTGALAKFVNAGISLDKAVPAIKGIANMTALAGQGAGAASIAMYNLSQSLAGGFLTTTDYKSLNLANVATKEWKDNMIKAAVSAGTLKKVGGDAYHIAGAKAGTASTSAALFNEKLAEGWATSKVLLQVLGDYGNPLTDIGRKALAAAQDVKSLPMMMETLKAGVGTTWTDTFEIVIGNLKESKVLFTGLTNYVGGFLGKMAKSRNDMLKGWRKFGGRQALIDGLTNGFQALLSLIKPIKDAFNQMFPAMTGRHLAQLTGNFRDFMAGLKMGPESMDRLKRSFAGVFAIFKVGQTIISAVLKTLFNLFGIAQGGAGGFLALTAAVGDFLVGIQKWLVSSGRIQSFFSTIDTARAAVMVPLIAIVGNLAEAFAALISGDMSGFTKKIKEAFGGIGPLIDGVWKGLTANVQKLLANLRDGTGIAAEFLKGLGVKALQPISSMLATLAENFGKLRLLIRNFGFDVFNKGVSGANGTVSVLGATGERIRSIWDGIKSAFEATSTVLGPVTNKIGNLFGTITDKLTEFIKNLNLQDAIALLNTGMFILMFKQIKNFTKMLSDMVSPFKDLGQNIKDTLDVVKGALTDSLKTMQQGVKAKIILEIAVAIGILAAALWVLSRIDPGKLGMAVGAVSVLLIGLVLALKTVMGALAVVEGQAPTKIGAVLAAGGAMVLLAGAVLLLSVAVKNLSNMSPAELAKGLISTAALLGALGLFAKFADMEKMSMKGAASLALLAGAIYLLSFSVSKLGQMDQGALIQGALAVQAILMTLVMVSTLMGNPESLKGAAGIVILAGALAILAPVLAALGLLPYEVLGKGLGTVAIALGLLVGASLLMANPETIAGAAGIALLAAAIAILAPALALFGVLPYEVLAKGLVTVAIALGIMVVASRLMGSPESLMGAAGILALAFAMQMLAPVLVMLSVIPMANLGVALGALAIALGIFLVAGAVAGTGPVAVGLIILSAAILAIGLGLGIAGAGFLAFATGFAALVAVGAAGFAILVTGFTGLMALIPIFAQQIGMALIAVADVVAASGPTIIRALTTVLISFLKAIQNAAPQFFSTMVTLILGLVRAVTTIVPQVAMAGATMILKLMTIIAAYIPAFARKATDLMIAFMGAIAREVPRLVDAGMKMITDLLNGIAGAIRNNSAAMNAAGRNVASAIVEGMVGGISGGIGSVVNAAKNMAKGALDAAKNFLGIHSPSKKFAELGAFSGAGFAQGLRGSRPVIEKAVASIVDTAMASMRTLVADTNTAVLKDVAAAQARLNALNKAKKKDRGAISRAKAALAAAKLEQKKVTLANWMLRTFNDEQAALNKLSTSYTAVTESLKEANKTLEDAKKIRDDFAGSTADQYDNLPDFTKETKISDFVTELEKQVVDTQIFTAQLEELRKQGLNDDLYKQLLSKGPDAGMPFAQQLLEGGQASIDQVNMLDSALAKAASALGTSASTALYQAAVDSAAGLVKGLEAQQANIAAQMDKIALGMVTAIKRALGIKSPSRAFMKIGDWSVQGLAKGIEQSASVSEKAAEQVGHGTIDALRKTLSGMSEAVMAGVDIDPTIRPVLDLTAIQRDALKMGEILKGSDLEIAAAFAQAKVASNDYSSNQNAQQEMAMAGSDTFTFNQTNNSPKALSEATIYRQTKNQISTAKGALKN